MNAISWNCRGTASKGFVGLIKDLRREFCASMIILMETHNSGAAAQKIIRRIGLDSQYIEEARGHSGGLWCLWDSTIWTV